MVSHTALCLAALACLACAGASTLVGNATVPELAQRATFSNSSLQYDFPPSSVYSNSAAGTTYTMDLKSNPILATLPSPGLSSKIDQFAPCSLKIPHVHPRASKYSFVVSGTLEVGIAEEDTGRILAFNVTQGSAIVVPQGLLHFMKNNDCSKGLTMLTVFNNVDPGELTMLDKILAFPNDIVLASTGLPQATVDTFKASLPMGPGDLRVDPGCQAACAAADVAATAGK